MRNKWKIKPATVIMFLIMAIVGATFIYPFYYMFISSVKSAVEYYQYPFSWPQGEFVWQTYKTMISNFKIFRNFGNTIIVVVGTLILVIPISICSAFTFAKYKFKHKNLLYLFMVASMTIPAQVTAIPVYVIFGKLGLLNTYVGMIIANLGMVCGCIVMMSSFFRAIPRELLDSAKIDGCGYLRTILNVVIPIGKPVIMIQIILSVNTIWNELFMSKIILQKNNVKTIMPALADLVGKYDSEPTYLMAGMLLSVLPTLLIFLTFQKHIIKGVLAGSVKG